VGCPGSEGELLDIKRPSSPAKFKGWGKGSAIAQEGRGRGSLSHWYSSLEKTVRRQSRDPHELALSSIAGRQGYRRFFFLKGGKE